MFRRSYNAHCLTCLVLGVIFMFPMIQTVSAEQVRSLQAKEASLNSKLDILPTLKGHMARLGTLMNVLFRDIDDAKRKELVLSTLNEMRLLLTKVGNEFIPTKVKALAKGDAKSEAITGFKSCIERAVSFLDEMRIQVKGAKFTEAKNSLYALDGWRRDCHSKYAGE